jgi:WD40 repeat protein
MSATLNDEIVGYLNSEGARLAARSRALLEAFMALAEKAGGSRIAATALRGELGAREGRTPSATTLRQRLKRLNDSLSTHKAPFQLRSGSGDVVAEPTAKFDANRQMERVHDALREISNEATRVDAGGMIEPKAAPESQVLWVFFSYASLNKSEQRIQNDFFNLLNEKLAYPPPQLDGLPKIKLWRDEHHIAPTRQGDPQMDIGCSQAFLGILMVSNKYHHSPYCTREASYFVTEDGQDKKGKSSLVINVNLRRGEISKKFTHGTRIIQPESKGKHLVQLWSKGDAHDRIDFTDRIAKQIFTAARDYLGLESTDVRRSTEDIARFMHERKYPTDLRDIVDPRARRGLISPSIGNGKRARDPQDEGVPIVQHLLDWALVDSRRAPRLIALLGEFGMGKTVACQIFTQRLLDLGKSDRAVPVPIYLDLRDVDASINSQVPNLETLIDQMLRKAGERPPSARDVIKFARDRGAIVVFDGLDEITNKLSPDVAVKLYRELLGIVPSECWVEDNERRRFARTRKEVSGYALRGPRVIVSCRTHYFRDVAAQRAFLTGMERARLEADEDVTAFFMLPFTDEQIEAYLTIHFGKVEADQALDLIKETYNLHELATRPILLRFIRETIGRIENEKLAGKVVNLARLYDILVEQVFERDNPKHIIPTREKREILQNLVLHLHERGQNEIGHDKLDAWFQQYIGTVPRLAAAVHGAGGLTLSEIFAQDLRNASLLVRPGDAAFRFAHTSVQEYFLASALHATVRTGKGNTGWDVPLPTRETIEFLLQRQAIEDQPDQRLFTREVARLLEPGHQLRSRLLAFHVWRRAMETDSPLERPKQMDLSGIDLSGQKLIGERDRLFPLENTLWHGAHLNQTEFFHVDLSRAHFLGVEAPMSRWLACRFGSSGFDGANLKGSLWRDCSIPEGTLDGADLDGARAIRCVRSGRNWRPQRKPGADAKSWRVRPLAFGAIQSIGVISHQGEKVIISGGSDGAIRTFGLTSGAPLAVIQAHTRPITSMIVISHGDKNVLVSGSSHGSISRIDLASGRHLGFIEEHRGAVNSIAVISDAGKEIIVSGGQDGTVRTFDSTSGKSLRVIETGERSVLSIALILQGQRYAVLTGGNDGTIRSFDLTSGAQLAVIETGQRGVNCMLVISRNGRKVVASGGYDGTVRFFDLASGTPSAVIKGHTDWVRSIAVTSEGGEDVLISASDDTTIRAVNLTSGALVAVLEGHRSWIKSIAVTSYGGKSVVVSAGYDSTIRIFDLASGAVRIVLDGQRTAVISMSLCSYEGADIVLSGDDDGVIRGFDLASGKRILTFESSSTGMTDVADVAVTWHAGKSVVVLGGFNGIGAVDLASGAPLGFVRSAIAHVRRMALVSDGKRTIVIALEHGGRIKMIDLVSGRRRTPAKGISRGVTSVAVTSGRRGGLMVFGYDNGMIRAFSVGSSRERAMVKAHRDNVTSLGVTSYEGKDVIVSGGADGKICVFDITSGALRTINGGNLGRVTSIATARHNGTHVIISVSHDGGIHVFDLTSGKVLAALKTHQSHVTSIAAISREGKDIIVSGDHDGTIRVLRFASNSFDLAETLCIFTGTDSIVRTRPAGAAGDSLVQKSSEAWRDWAAEYQVGDLMHMTDLDDLPVAEAAAEAA